MGHPAARTVPDSVPEARGTSREGSRDESRSRDRACHGENGQDNAWWGLYADDAYAQFGGAPIAQYGVAGPHGWLDLPLAEAAARAAELTAWRDRLHGKGLMVSVDEHTDFYRFQRAGWHHPLQAGAIDVGGCRVLGIEWDHGDHSIRHRGERDAGQVYPVTLEAHEAGEMVMRWTIPPYDFDEMSDEPSPGIRQRR